MKKKRLIDQIVNDAKSACSKLKSDNKRTLTYIKTYPAFIHYFQEIQIIEPHHLIIAANFTYGWMRTALTFKSQNISNSRFKDDIGAAVKILNRAKSEGKISDDELMTLKRLLNNSMVGTSKLLHFVNPKSFCIWDNKVYKYIHKKDLLAHRQTPQNYLEDLKACREVVNQKNRAKFRRVHASINQALGYSVSPIRAAEIVMFMKRVRT